MKKSKEVEYTRWERTPERVTEKYQKTDLTYVVILPRYEVPEQPSGEGEFRLIHSLNRILNSHYTSHGLCTYNLTINTINSQVVSNLTK